MSDEFTLYGYTFRSRTERVLWALREFAYPHKVIRLDPLKGETRNEAFLRLNPSGKMPVLCQGEEVYTESLAIMEYLNDISEHKKLIPLDPKAAYQYRKIVHYGLTEIEPYLWLAAQSSYLKHLYKWPVGSYEEAIARVNESIVTVWPWIESGEFIAHSEFTLADIYFYHLITWAKQYGIEYPQSVVEYLARLQARTAFPEELLPD